METISSSVGLRGVNFYKDVFLVQSLLKDNGFPYLKEDGVCGRNTIKAILAYQKAFYHHPDGLVSPGNKTINLLTSKNPHSIKSLPKAFGATGVNRAGKRTNVAAMSPSPQAYELLMKYEEKINYPYSDEDSSYHKEKLSSWNKTATIGYGHLIKNSADFEIFKKGLDDDEIYKLFKSDTDWIFKAVKGYIKVDLTQNEFDALFILAYNIGPGAPDNPHFRRHHSHKGLYWSKVLKIVNAEISDDLDKAWLAYDYSRGEFSRGLLNRRKSELNVYHNGVYQKL